jgi:hypothetical protein
MYGVPADLDLRPFVGGFLTQISLGEFDLQFHFVGDRGIHLGTISVQGGWELRDSHSEVIDKATDNNARAEYRIHRLLGRTVTAVRIDPPQSFTVIFDNGSALTVLDDSDGYESCQIDPGGIII